MPLSQDTFQRNTVPERAEATDALIKSLSEGNQGFPSLLS